MPHEGVSEYHPRAAGRHLRIVPQSGRETRDRRERPPHAQRSAKDKHENKKRHVHAQGAAPERSRIQPCRSGQVPHQFPVRTHIHPYQNTLSPLIIYDTLLLCPTGYGTMGSSLPLPEQPKTQSAIKRRPEGRPYGEILWQACRSPASLGFPLSIPAACG